MKVTRTENFDGSLRTVIAGYLEQSTVVIHGV